MSFTVQAVIENLGYRQPGDLLSTDDPAIKVSPPRRQAWGEATERLGVHAAYFQGGMPIVYFHGLALPDAAEVDERIEQLHRKAWNHGRAPFTVVVLPNEVRVLDNLSAPTADFTLLRAHDDRPLSETLVEFSRSELLAGSLARTLTARPRETVVARLRRDLRAAREDLHALGLEEGTARDLLGRSLFLQYLAHRGILGRITSTTSFEDVLSGPTHDLYALFDAVYERFNGDVFPVTPVERADVGAAHLMVVLGLLRGAASYGQMQLFSLYDFSVIPAEVLSTIYEEFIADERSHQAAYYTPEQIVDLALDECVPLHAQAGSIRVLDPACGSGIFLARAYRRLIDLRRTAADRRLAPEELSTLLRESIFGCDIMLNAVRVAAFSCYLVLLDHCDLDDLDGSVRFPPLVGHNLVVGDFFARIDDLTGPFDIIATNPPWKRATAAAEQWVKASDRPIGDRQIAHAFYWACEERLAGTGSMSMLLPAKALYNRSRPNTRFREEILRTTGLELVVDFSPFRRELFTDASAPMALLVTRGRELRRREDVTFCTPSPSPLSRSTGRFVLSGEDFKRVSREDAAERPGLLKTMQLGTLRDATLVERLALRYPPLASLEEAGWLIGSGYQVGGGDQRKSEFLNMIPHVESRNITPLLIEEYSEPEAAETFHRTRSDALFRAPHVLVARTIDPQGRLHAAFSDRDSSFTTTVIGIAAPSGHATRVKALAALLNSSILRYVVFLTATNVGAERPAIDPQDLRRLPIALPPAGSSEETELNRIVDSAQHGASTRKHLFTELDDIAAELYRLRPGQRALVRDFLRYGVDAHFRPLDAIAFDRPDEEQLNRYRDALESRLARAFDVATDARLFDDGAGYISVSVGLGAASADSPPHRALVGSRHEGIAEGEAVMLRRNFRLYHPRRVDVAKPAEARQWTDTAAATDADEIIAESLDATSQSADVA